MKYIYYLQNGISVNLLPAGYDGFYVAENTNANSELSRYYYPGDDVQYDLDTLCVKLYDVFQDTVFPDREDYYRNCEIQPQWISRAGLDSDFNMSQNQLIKCFSVPIHEVIAGFGIKNEVALKIYQEIESKKFKYAYVADCQSLINTLQELILGCHSSFIGFYKQLCTLHNTPQMEGTYYECSSESRMVYSFLYSFIIQCYSAFDILTKIAYELENIKSCDDSYAKLASSNILYGDKKHLTMNITGTIFEKCYTTSVVENLRNELVHNATWEMNPKIFVDTENGIITARYIFLPDFTEEGTLVAFKNRKRFFSKGKKVNEELSLLYFDILKKIHVTLERMIKLQ